MLRKKKVDFATGARTLRGGKNHYTPKTFCGNWVEGQTDPSYKALAEQTKYDKNWESVAKTDMKNGVGVKISRYGEGMNAYVKYPDHWLDYVFCDNHDETKRIHNQRHVCGKLQEALDFGRRGIG
eukprot:g15708.t1